MFAKSARNLAPGLCPPAENAKRTESLLASFEELSKYELFVAQRGDTVWALQ